MGRPDDLLTAVKEGDRATLIRLLNKIQSAAKSKSGGSKKLNINQLDSKGLSALHYAVQTNNLEAMSLLLDTGAKVDVIDEKGVRPLHLAASADKVDAVRLLIQRNSKVNEAAFDGNTPLHVAAEYGHLDTVNVLLDCKADPTIQNCNHKTALDLACEFGSDQIVERFIESKLCHKQLTEVLPAREAETRRHTCLHLAARNGQVGVIRQLMKAGFDINSCSMNGTALHEAVAYNQADAVALLCDLNIDAGVLNAQKMTAFDLVKERHSLAGQEKLCQRLKDAARRPLIARAIRSYNNRQDPTHLSFNEGDLITVTERHQGGMWKGFVCGGGGGGNALYQSPQNQSSSPSALAAPKFFPASDVERVITGGLRQGSSSPFPSADWAGRSQYPCNNNGLHGDCRHDANPYSVTVGVDQSFPLPPSPIGKSRTFTSDSSGDSGIDLRLTSSPQTASPLQPFPTRPQKLTPTTLTSAQQLASFDWSNHAAAGNAAVNHHQVAASAAAAVAQQQQHHQHNHHHHRSASPMFNKTNSSPTGSNRSSTASSSGSGSSSSGYLGSSGQVNNGSGGSPGVVGVGGVQAQQPHQYLGSSGRLHDSGLATSASRFSYTSHGSLEDQPLTVGHPSDPQHLLQASGGRVGPPSPAIGSSSTHISDLYQQGKYQDSEILRMWLAEQQLTDFYQLFIQAGYDMPTISRMTPEDLTAIGITNPAIRKKLTYEISRLRICDRIPNYRPGTVLEWLQLLKLEQYYDVLMKEGYSTFNKIIDIAWEDLEEIGFRKLGHQKKIILAIDRLKKLGSRRVSSQDPSSSVDAARGFANQSVSMYEGCPLSNTSTTRVDRISQAVVTPMRLCKSGSGDSIHAMSRAGMSVCTKPVDIDRAGSECQSSEAGQASSRRPASAHPEVVAIQVRRDPLPRALSSSNDDIVTGDHPVTYESFHGDPSNDFSSLLASDANYNRGGDATPTNDMGSLSSDEMDNSNMCRSFAGRTLTAAFDEVDASGFSKSQGQKVRPQVAPRPDLRARRSSGDSARFGGGSSASSAGSESNVATATINSGYGSLKRRVSCKETSSTSMGDRHQVAEVHTPKVACRVTPINYQSSTDPARGTAFNAVASSTPSHNSAVTQIGPSEATPSAGAQGSNSKAKKAPPPPPKRTNSVKEDVRTNPTQNVSLNISSPASSSCTQNINKPAVHAPELVLTGAAGGPSGFDLTFGEEDSSTLDQVIERLQWSGDQSIRPAKHRDRRITHSSSPTPPHVTSMAGLELRETSATLGRHPSSSTSLNRSDSNCSSCSGDSNTLPFANENVGTIRQKFTSAAATGNLSSDGSSTRKLESTVDGASSLFSSSSSRNNDGGQKGAEPKKIAKPVPAQKPQINRVTQSTSSVSPKQQLSAELSPITYNGLADDVFSDIDSMLHGLTQELDDMLISKD